ncbi:MAG TPA: O-antigen ligase family protein [Candidatus Limnocylindria bacterium]|nr:O-antigen ligase family protein [Candidatus Limnocylindria bacterium]
MIFRPGLRKRNVLLQQVAPHLSGNGTLALGNSGASHSSVSTDHQAPYVFIRRQIRGRIINIWLVLIVALGAVIAVGDGLTRAPNLELELSPPQPLGYEPYYAAFLLAGVTLPLMFAYVKKARVSLAEGLFLWFAFCTTAYAKDFSYLRWPGTPLFVTDVVLIVLLLSIYIVPRRRYSHLPLVLSIFLGLFIAAGVLAAARGFLGRCDPILVLRDSALIGYALFLLVGYHLFSGWLAIRRVAAWFLLGTALSVLNGLAWLVVAPEQRRFVAPGVYVLVSLVGVLIMLANRLIRPRVGWLFVGVFSLGLLLANARSLFVCLAIVFLVVLFVPGMLRRKLRSARLVTTLATAAVLVCAFAFLFLHLQVGRDFTTRVADNMASGILHTGDDAFWQFRLTAWKEARRRFEQYPPAGEGFGIPFNFEIWDNDPRPHNTFVTVLYKMGLLGFLPLFALLAYFFWFCLRAVHRNSANGRISFLQMLILAQVSFCVWGGADSMLESPYLASLFWVGMGIGLHIAQKLDYERSLQIVSYFPRRNDEIFQSAHRKGAASDAVLPL